MNNPLNVFVRAGELLSAKAWNAALRFILSLRLTAGPGVKLSIGPNGTIISVDRQRFDRSHAFKCALLGAMGVRIQPGLVAGIIPSVGKEPLDEERALLWAKPLFDATGRGWVALEVTFGAKWEVISAQVVQVADLDTLDGLPAKADAAKPPGYAAGAPLTISTGKTDKKTKLVDRRARHPLAMIRKRDNGALVLFQITQHNLNHRAAVQGKDDKIARHFFFAAP